MSDEQLPEQEIAILPSWVLNEVLAYLARQPYHEVAPLISAIHTHVEIRESSPS